MNKKELAEQILRKHIAWDCSDSDIEYYKQLNGRIWNGAIAAIIEAMDTKPEDANLSNLAQKYANLSHEDFDGNIDLHYANGFVAGYWRAKQSVEAMGVQPGAEVEQKFHAVDYSGFWSIQTSPYYEERVDILNAEAVGEKEAREYANLIVKLLNKHYAKRD